MPEHTDGAVMTGPSAFDEGGPPPLVRRYVAGVLPPDAGAVSRVRITQVGEMRRGPEARWRPFSADEELAVSDVSFVWRARFPIASALWLRVVDRYSRGEGMLEARLCGLLPVMRSRSQDTAEAQAIRYLAELPWAPPAMVANHELEWREIDPGVVEVATRVASARVAVHLEFDDAGDVVAASTPRRPRVEHGTTTRAPWAGAFSEYASFGGVRVPTRAEVSWELPDGAFTYWRGAITSLEAIP